VTQCNYIYASGLRIKEGDGVVIVGGRALRVIRDGSGRSNPDLPLPGSASLGTITLRDLREELLVREHPAITLFVDHVTPDGKQLSFYVDLDPSAAMGRQGREGDFRDAAEKMKPAARTSAALYQLTTLPYSNKQSGSETADRLRFSIEEAGGLEAALPYLDYRFALHADQSLLDEALSFCRSAKGKRDGDMIRVAGAVMGDPSRVSEEHFTLAYRYFQLFSTHHADGHIFVDSAFERLPDNSLHDILYNGLTGVSSRGEYLRLITDPLRLQRITEWYERGPRSSSGVRSPGYHVEFLSRVARSVSEQLKNDAALAGALGA
jgi:hypothetical protein